MPVAPNLLDGNLSPPEPNQAWTSEGWLYLAVVIDLFNREVEGGSIKPRKTMESVMNALRMAWLRRKPAQGLLHHSDRGSHDAAGAFQDLLREYGWACSMRRNGNCGDNAPTERGFGNFKNERIHSETPVDQKTMREIAFVYIEVFYHRKRRQSTLCDQS